MKTEDILRAVKHRNYPLPQGPWVMKQNWHELLFAHWPITSAVLRPMIPACLELDTFEGECWVGVVPFRMTGVRPRGIPAVPWLSSFPELNVRTYVTYQGIPGVYFFSLDAGNPLAVFLARTLFHLPYFNAHMECKLVGDVVHYSSHRTHRGVAEADYIARYRPVAPVVESHEASIEAWLTERYCLYTVAGQHLYRGDIHHIRWPLQVAELETIRDTMALAHGLRLPATKPLLHYASRQDVLIWPLLRLR